MEGIFDNHNHSQFSFDGKRTTIRLSAEAAAGKGLTGICFTDHYDAYVPPMKADFEHLVPETFDIEKQQKEITETILDTGYPILKGIEIGLHSKCRQEIRRILSINHFDQIIASVHYIDDTDPYYGSYYRDKDWKEAYGHYLETLYTEMKWLGDFDIMGHFDYIVRYAGYPENSMQYRYFSDIFDEIFKFLIEEGKALEINTKTYQEHNGRLTVLDTGILKRYREMGGEILSLGSDSHDPGRVGENFGQHMEMLKNLGFKYLAHYEGRKLIQSPMR